jgi:CheY-like chemotaxis protein
VARAANILLVEDDPNDALLVCMAFKRTLSGIPVFAVSNGLEAVRYLKGEAEYGDRQTNPFPDLVLLDLKMPVMNGFEFLRWVRAQASLRRLPVIVLTSSLDESDPTQAYDAGANSYVVKPTDFNQLTQAIQRLGDFWLTQTLLPDASPPTG